MNMTKKQAINSINDMFEKMIPVFKDSWSEERDIEQFSFRTYKDGHDYAVIELSGDYKISLHFSKGEIKIQQVLGKELSAQSLQKLIEILFKATFSYEILSSEKQIAIKKIRDIKKSINKSKSEIDLLQRHLENIKKVQK